MQFTTIIGSQADYIQHHSIKPKHYPCPQCGKKGKRKQVNILPGMNAGASNYAVPSPIKGSGTAWVLLGSWALSPARPTPIHPRHECRGLSALFGDHPTHSSHSGAVSRSLDCRGSWRV